MSRIEYVEIGGHRYTGAEIRAHTHVDYRCDVCGEFVAEEAMVTINVTVHKLGDPMTYLPPRYFHPEHVPAPFAADPGR